MVDGNKVDMAICRPTCDKENISCKSQFDHKYSTFTKFHLDFDQLKQKTDYKSCETLEILNVSYDALKELAIKQLNSRDLLIDTYRNNHTMLINHGMALEMDIMRLQLKIEELSDQIKKIKKLKRKKLKDFNIKESYCEDNKIIDEEGEAICILKDEPVKFVKKVNSEENLAIKHNEKLNLANDASATEEKVIQNSDDSQGALEIIKDVENTKRWNSSNIVVEVQCLAEKIVTNSGYIFLEEYGMYYDSSSGYYYDPNTTLYYDGVTGTYFYYDHDSQCYKFHSQVDGLQSNSNTDLSTKKKKNGNNDAKSHQDKDLEDGECSSSSNELSDDVNGCQSPEMSKGEDICEYNQKDIAPSLRLMVTNGVFKGQLHIVTLDGGSIGREETNTVFLQDQSVSKLHANIIYKSEGPNDHHYYIKDIGSNNGTLVRGQRLSDSRKESQWVELGHGWGMQCGTICLSCHIHPGHLTCNACEPGLIIDHFKLKYTSTNNSSQMDGISKEKERRRQNKCLRKKFALEWHADNEQLPSNLLYQDRTAIRKDTVGSENPYQKTEVASIDINIPKDNKGFQLLEKMGWSEGQGLGLKKDGITLPIVPIVPFNRTGLGGCPSIYNGQNKSSECKTASTSTKFVAGTISAIDFTPALEDVT